jgi:hypothetical protein
VIGIAIFPGSAEDKSLREPLSTWDASQLLRMDCNSAVVSIP